MIVRRALLAWAALAVAMSLNGIFRELVLRRFASGAAADVLSAALGACIILGVTRPLFAGFGTAPTRSLVVAAIMLFVLTVAFEFTMGRLVDHKSWAELVGNYAIWRGKLWPLLLLLVALSPFIWGRWVRVTPPQG